MRYFCKNKLDVATPKQFLSYKAACTYDRFSVWAEDHLGNKIYTTQDLADLQAWLYDHIMTAGGQYSDLDNWEIYKDLLDQYDSGCFADLDDPALYREVSIRAAAIAINNGHLDSALAEFEAFETIRSESEKL